MKKVFEEPTIELVKILDVTTLSLDDNNELEGVGSNSSVGGLG
jgi:hypothetical protein